MSEIKKSKVFRWLVESRKPIKILQGGSGSSKTYSILQNIILRCFIDLKRADGSYLPRYKNETIDIIRRTLPALKMSAMKDFEDILKGMGIFEKVDHNISQNTYRLGSNIVRFYSTDDEQKMRGPRRGVSYFNEILEMKRIDVIQVLMRTNLEVFADFNPSEEIHWVYDELLPGESGRDDVDFMISTHNDNPFLSPRARAEIERLKEIDPNLYRIYGEGQRGISQANVFYSVDYAPKEMTWEKFEGEILCGEDFGFNDPTVLVRVKLNDKAILVDQLLYKTSLTSDMISKQMDNLVVNKDLDPSWRIDCDSSRPEIIEELYKQGYNAHPVKKGKDSILRGINFLKMRKIYFTERSVEAYREFKGYKWKVDKNDKIIDGDPVGINDHSIDAVRYAVSERSRNRREIGAA